MMNLSMGLRWGLVLLSGALLSACLVGKDETKDYTISLPSKLPTYANGHYIKFGYELYGSIEGGIQTTTTSGNLNMNWALTSLPLPFGSSSRTVLQHTVKESTVDGDRISIQYLTQDISTNTVLLNAYRGVTNSYWPDANGSLNDTDIPSTITTFVSPIEDGLGGSWINNDQSSGGALDHAVMGACTSSTCFKLAQFNFTNYTIEGIDNLTTPLGNFEAYRLHYSGILTPEPALSETAYLDYRVSCGSSGSTTPVNFYGYVWIYPSIGPIKLQNNCTSGSRTIYFNAQITSTNLPH